MINPYFVILSMDDSEMERDEQRSAPTKKKCLFDDSIVGKVGHCLCFICKSEVLLKTYSGIFLILN